VPSGLGLSGTLPLPPRTGANSAQPSNLKPVGAPALGGGGGSAPTKVVLTKKTKSKVILSPPRSRTPNTLPHNTKHSKTRKSKKIHISLSGLSKKMGRAKKIKHDAKGTDIAEVKKSLVRIGLVKEATKAPEAILRQMYEDWLTLKNKAL
jgi:hypothetical protein